MVSWLKNRKRFILLLFFLFQSATMFPDDTGPLGHLQAADSLFATGLYVEAISQYFVCIDAQGKSGEDKDGMVATCSEKIGICYYKLDKYSEAIVWFRKALDLHRERQDLENVASALNNIGLNYKIMMKRSTTMSKRSASMKNWAKAVILP
jgi:tetratricopeptide (TPR) repeat protein